MAVHELASRSLWVVLLSATPHDGNETSLRRSVARAGGQGRDPLLVFRRSASHTPAASRAPNTRAGREPCTSRDVVHTLLTRYAQRVWASADTRAARRTPGHDRAAETRVLVDAALERSAGGVSSLLAAEPVGPRSNDCAGARHRERSSCKTTRSQTPCWRRGGSLTTPRTSVAGASSRRCGRSAPRAEARVGATLLGALMNRCCLHGVQGHPRVDRSDDRPSGSRRTVARGPDRTRARRRDRGILLRRARVLLATDAASLGLNLQQRCALVVNSSAVESNRVAQRVGRLAASANTRGARPDVVSRGTGEEQCSRCSRRAAEHSGQSGLDALPSRMRCPGHRLLSSIVSGATHRRTTGTETRRALRTRADVLRLASRLPAGCRPERLH